MFNTVLHEVFKVIQNREKEMLQNRVKEYECYADGTVNIGEIEDQYLNIYNYLLFE